MRSFLRKAINNREIKSIIMMKFINFQIISNLEQLVRSLIFFIVYDLIRHVFAEYEYIRG